MYQHPVICSFVSNVTKPVLWIHSLTLCAASAFSLYYVMGPVRIFLCPHWMMPAHALRYPSVSLSGYRAYVCFKAFVNTELKRPTCATSGNCNVLIYGTVTTTLCVVVTDHRILRKKCQLPGIMFRGAAGTLPRRSFDAG